MVEAEETEDLRRTTRASKATAARDARDDREAKMELVLVAALLGLSRPQARWADGLYDEALIMRAKLRDNCEPE